MISHFFTAPKSSPQCHPVIARGPHNAGQRPDMPGTVSRIKLCIHSISIWGECLDRTMTYPVITEGYIPDNCSLTSCCVRRRWVEPFAWSF